MIEPDRCNLLAGLRVRKNIARLDLDTPIIRTDRIVSGLTCVGEFETKQPRRRYLADLAGDPERLARELAITSGSCLGDFDGAVERGEIE